MVDLEALARECGVQLYDVETVSENGRTIYRISRSKLPRKTANTATD